MGGPTYKDTYEGSQIFSMAPFRNFTAVYAMYCDGGSWLGNVSAPIKTQSGSTIYYRGRLLLDAMIDNLLGVQGMSNAKYLLYGGCSAGGLTAYLNTDYVASRMPSTTQTLAIADAMFSLNSESWDGRNLFPAAMEWGYKAWNAGASVNQACLNSYGAADGWKCMFGGNAARFVSTPLFVLNSKYDTWQEKAIIGAPGVITKCPMNVSAFWIKYAHQMVAKADALPAQHGVFLTNCPAHCQTGTKSSWDQTTVGNTSIGDAFLAWWIAHTGSMMGMHKSTGGWEDGLAHIHEFRWIDRCDVEPCVTNICG